MFAVGAICLLVLCFGSISESEANENFTIVLHARTPGGTGACSASDLPTCPPPGEPGIRPTTQVAAGASFCLYIFVNNYTDIQALETAFAWPADWKADPDGKDPSFIGCRSNEIVVAEPRNPGGSTSGILATAFDCVTGPELCLLGHVDFVAGQSGCLTQVNSPVGDREGVALHDCQNQTVLIDARWGAGQIRLGSICVGHPGQDACNPLTPVEPSTWGRIKASYQ